MIKSGLATRDARRLLARDELENEKYSQVGQTIGNINLEIR